jgi:predicted nucleic acid-binding protein
MDRIVVLDSGPLGRIAHPRPNAEIAEWLRAHLEAGTEIAIPEVIDYEQRRAFLHKIEQFQASLDRLNELKEQLTFLPLNSDVMLRAAQFWADLRRAGLPTTDDRRLDVDVILASQTVEVGGIIATENVGHLNRMTDALSWKEILP